MMDAICPQTPTSEEKNRGGQHEAVVPKAKLRTPQLAGASREVPPCADLFQSRDQQRMDVQSTRVSLDSLHSKSREAQLAEDAKLAAALQSQERNSNWWDLEDAEERALKKVAQKASRAARSFRRSGADAATEKVSVPQRQENRVALHQQYESTVNYEPVTHQFQSESFETPVQAEECRSSSEEEDQLDVGTISSLELFQQYPVALATGPETAHGAMLLPPLPPPAPGVVFDLDVGASGQLAKEWPAQKANTGDLASSQIVES